MVNFLHPKILGMLPASTQGLTAYYSLLAATCRDAKSEGGWTQRGQASLARAIHKGRRSVKLYERVLKDLELVEVRHHGHANRRLIRVRELDDVLHLAGSRKACPKLRRWRKEWGNALPHSGATRCPTPPALSISQTPRRKVLEEPPILHAHAGSKPRGRGNEQARSGPGKDPEPELLSLGLGRELLAWCDELGVWRRERPRVGELVRGLVKLQGERQTLGMLRTASKAVYDCERGEKAKRAIGCLASRLRKLEELHAPRGGFLRL